MTSRLLRSKYILLLLLLVIPVFSYAQNTTGFSVSPTIFDVTASPGQSWESSVRIINPNPYDLQLYITRSNFRPRAETGVPEFIPIDDNPETIPTFAEWVTVPESVLVPAEKTIELPMNIKVPENGDPGGHFAALQIGTRPPTEEGSTQVSTAQIISTLLLLRVTGEVNEVASIRSFRTTDFFLSSPEATLELRIENKGNVHIQPQGRVTFYNMWGQERGEIPFNQENLFGNVLPESVRKFTFDWRSDWSLADIGRYRAKAVLSYGNTQRHSLTAETTFWVIPWLWVLITLLVVGGFVYGFVFSIKLYIRRVLALSGFQQRPELTNQVSITPKSKRINIMAPIEAGMLDLRQELSSTKDKKEQLLAYFHIIKKYRTFFYTLLAIAIFVYVCFWYISSGLKERDYTIVTESGEIVREADADAARAMPVSTETLIPVRLVDRSGSAAAVQGIALELEKLGFYVTEVTTDTVEDRSVVVFSPSYTDEALKLSALLKNAPLSALPENPEAPELTVLIGSDILVTEE